MRTIRVLTILAMMFFAAPAQAAIELVDNGDFETGDFTGWTTTPAASGSVFFVDSFGIGGSFGAIFQAFDSQHDSISQFIPTTPGAQYTLSFFLSNHESGNDSFQVLWDGALVFDETPVVSAAAFPAFTQFSFDVVASGAATPLEFRGYEKPAFLVLDNVSVMAAPTGAVPEAASLAVWSGLGLIGGGGAACIRRRLGAAA